MSDQMEDKLGVRPETRERQDQGGGHGTPDQMGDKTGDKRKQTRKREGQRGGHSIPDQMGGKQGDKAGDNRKDTLRLRKHGEAQQ